jgi:DNA-directed RNA polymerase sigma subunit (sigma70/sigma32)
LADEYGISAERVRQVESNAINKLKGLMSAA